MIHKVSKLPFCYVRGNHQPAVLCRQEAGDARLWPGSDLATVVFAVSLAVIAFGLCAVKLESHLFNGCVETVLAEGRSHAEAVRYCNGG